MMRIIFLTLIFNFIAFGFTGCSAPPTEPDGTPVGLVRLDLTDPVRKNWEETGARPLATTLWYPAIDGTEMIEIGIPRDRPVFIGGFAARNAKISDTHGTYPLIVMSHGTGGAGMQMMWLGRELAANGYIVAAIDHHGNTAAEEQFDPRGFRMPWERARDVTTVLDLLIEDPVWGQRIDDTRIGAVGFSLGGYTVTALSGGRIDFDQFEEFCRSDQRDVTCDEQSEYPEAGAKFDAILKADPKLAARMSEHRGSFRDERISAVIALAPALGQAFTENSLSDIAIPYLSIVGDLDQVAPAATNGDRLVRHIPDAQSEHIFGSNHYSFLNRCNRRGERYVPICKDAASGKPRTAAHQETIQLILEFLRANIGASKQLPRRLE